MQELSLNTRELDDSVLHNELLAQLQGKQVLENVNFGTKSFVQNRKCHMVVGEAEKHCSLKCGVPKGSPLSPTLFLVHTSDLL